MSESEGRGVATEAYDVVVVGSGPVGTAVARELADLDPGLRLLVLEAGGVLGETPGGHVKNIADAGAREAALAALPPSRDALPGGRPARPGTALVGAPDMPNAAISTNVGGMGAHWTAACPLPGDDEVPDFLDRDSFDDALARAADLLAVTTHAFDGAPLTPAVLRVLGEVFDGPGRRPVGPMPVAVRREADGQLHWTGPAVVAGDLWERPQVTLRAGTLARRVRIEGPTVTGVEVVDVATGRSEVLAARAVLVAADAFRTPQLLWTSGIRPAALGRYLNDQPQVMLASLVAEEHVPADAVGLGAVPTSVATTPGGGAIVPLSGVSWVPYAADRPFHGQVMQLDASPVPLEPDVTVRPGQVVGLGWFCRKQLSAQDRVWFDERELDEHGMPAIRIDYTLTAADEESIAAATAEIRRAAAALGRTLGEPFTMPAGTSLHYQGTTRMGPVDDGTSVCDTTGRVWGTENLYVGGNNVIPTSTACNPTVTAVALGVLSARALLGRLAGVEGDAVAARAVPEGAQA
ncbi:GMC oxidoreductase [Modestobacter sp. VKM Ac-2986]|uniref:GMC oxidoreductase n=1 Tax=Modestobacter sp. VKM Ac-2986 TaxID=3004140 RepID=UPI0022AA4A18|nr:GMC oxidoreductase [Modestobacter sp. VKM Ac-2986]MCZ2828815.1 GMC oxidoreductase [Modestobacter sp. VKM Ac-2986]